MKIRAIFLVLSCFAVISCATPGSPPAPDTEGVNAFNAALSKATLAMDNAATLALWDDDGISLLPQSPPMIGKPAISRFMIEVTSQLAGAHMDRFELQCHDIDIAGDWGSEWCDEHQVVILPNGKPPFDGRGRLLLVLHRAPQQGWRMHREMWIPSSGSS